MSKSESKVIKLSKAKAKQVAMQLEEAIKVSKHTVTLIDLTNYLPRKFKKAMPEELMLAVNDTAYYLGKLGLKCRAVTEYGGQTDCKMPVAIWK